MTHEAGVWSNIHNKWFFLPRRCSKEQFKKKKDGVKGCNVLLTADEAFDDVKVFILINSYIKYWGI